MKYILSSVLTIGIFVFCLSTNGYTWPSDGDNCSECHGDTYSDYETSDSTDSGSDTSESTDYSSDTSESTDSGSDTSDSTDWGSDTSDSTDYGSDTSDSTDYGSDTSDSTDYGSDTSDDSGWDYGDDIPGCGSSSGGGSGGCDLPSRREGGCGLPSRNTDGNTDSGSDVNTDSGSSDTTDGSSDASTDGSSDTSTDSSSGGRPGGHSRHDRNTDCWTDQNTDTDDGSTEDMTDTEYDTSYDTDTEYDTSYDTDTEYDTSDATDTEYDTSDDTDEDTSSSGSVTITGSGFSEGLVVGFLSLPGDTVFSSSLLTELTAADVEAFAAATISSDGSLENAISTGSPITLVDSSYATTTLEAGEHVIILIIDNEPAVTDYEGLTDIGENDMIGYTTVTVEGDQSLSIDYSAVTWTAVGDF